MDHINNGPYQILKKDPTAKIKPKTLKQLKALKDNTFIDIKQYYYLKLTDSPASRLNSHKKKTKKKQPGVPICPIISCSDYPLYSLS